ncbi:hypothetical protein DM860_001978 [Cuscuta australis]|uniref:Peroxidase n=1 Tax=Cuscuta australis TaxID=267555 RepID=A0A328DVE2_9ASTE|nr:hypothetical protein DM860_001978 [Cuscuta australis]
MPISYTPFVFFVLFLSSPSQANRKPNSGTRQPPPPRQFSVDFYAESCPHLDRIVASVTTKQYKQAPAVGPATIRLFFHDCFVQGCDASILISSKEMAERDAEENKDLSQYAFDAISEVKSAVETNCPAAAVSCADILAIAARDFVHLVGGPYYQVKKGRQDGNTSMASRVEPNLPRANSTLDQLLKLFGSKGLSLKDLVVLSGAHSIGFAHCKQFVSRLYNYSIKGTNNQTHRSSTTIMDPRLLKALRMSCPKFGGNANVLIPFDVETPFVLDNAYYGNLEAKMGLLASDQALFLDRRSRPLVQMLAKDKKKFHDKFALAMEKMGSIGVERGRIHGVGRKDCATPTS